MRKELCAEQRASETLRGELEGARGQAAGRSEELAAAVAALGEARQQLLAREKEATHWRAESARAVSRLEALTTHCEQQAEQTRALKAEVSDQRKAMAALRDQSELQHHALLAAEVARAEQSDRQHSTGPARPGRSQTDGSCAPQGRVRPDGAPPPPPSTPQAGSATAFVEVLAAGELRPPPRGGHG